MKNSESNGKFIIAMSRAINVTHKKSERYFKEKGLTMAQFMVLEALYHKGSCTITQLIESVLSTSGNMTVVVRNLEKQNLVSRTENPKDKRSYIIRLTKKGEEVTKEVFQKHLVYVNESLKPITNDEKETVIKILRKLTERRGK